MAAKNEDQMIQKHDDFFKKLYKSLSINGNVFVSPFNIYLLAHKLFQDAKDESANKILVKIFNLDSSISANQLFNYLNSFYFYEKRIYCFTPYTKIFLRDQYLKLQKNLTNNCGVNHVDFRDLNSLQNALDEWLKSVNEESISCVVNPETIAEFTRFIIATNLKFQANWSNKLIKLPSETGKFYLAENESCDVEMLRLDGNFKYNSVDKLDAKILEIPLQFEDISLVILMPNEKNGINDFEEKILDVDINEILGGVSERNAILSLPQLTFKQDLNLKNALCKVGFKDIFEKKINFSYLNGNKEALFVDDAEHNSFFKMNPDGILTRSVIRKTVVGDSPVIFPLNVVIEDINIKSRISNRFSKTDFRCKTKNLQKYPKETNFEVVLPEKANVSGFVMEINGKSYKSFIREKQEAKNIYDIATSKGKSAGHLATARDSNRFSISLNLQANSEAVFLLTYEELLERTNDHYELVININPGQLVQNLNVEVEINETKPIKFVKTPAIRSGNEVKSSEKTNPFAEIKIVDKSTAVVKFIANQGDQKQIALDLKQNDLNGLSGQFVVQYDVERDTSGSEVLLQDGYFVHFFAPDDLDPLPKHVIFVLDTSSSMQGSKIDQLKDAMKCILNEIKNNDTISIVEFNSSLNLWNIEKGAFVRVDHDMEINYEISSYNPFPRLDALNLPLPTQASGESINKAKEIVSKLYTTGSTYMIGALEAALHLVKVGKKHFTKTDYQPIIVFLTDGQPNVGLYSTDKITEIITCLNAKYEEYKTPIFSLSFGAGADKNFLRKLSLQNFGFSRHIYEAADASLQLQEFYKMISSPLLSDVQFKYESDVTDNSRLHFPIYFRGGELVVVGKCTDLEINGQIVCRGCGGCLSLRPKINQNPVNSLERFWAYLTVKQLLESRATVEDFGELKRLNERSLDLALRYSFVTDVTSLVVVKPDEDDVENKEASIENAADEGSVDFNRLLHRCSNFGSFGGGPAQYLSLSGSSGPLFGGGGNPPLTFPKNCKRRAISMLQSNSLKENNPFVGTFSKDSKQETAKENIVVDRPFLIFLIYRSKDKKRIMTLFRGRIVQIKDCCDGKPA